MLSKPGRGVPLYAPPLPVVAGTHNTPSPTSADPKPGYSRSQPKPGYSPRGG